ncbi:hypothetical protein CP10139811_0916 [Chlamydia ibidis]|uniref:Inclusion membrane protein n=2 Tax=Chlamydia ibidis TaxID=1405396 RepID=S7KGW7_9CHLA|nr:hypothetical protein [Chlamydia ibidis]EPP35416.1 hypothetical protein CP10139811_0916 [Chlamydia ibidis]EQM62841.1 hypothetical protein H359_0235 [Chlamydia ibidis 10-1398/6]
MATDHTNQNLVSSNTHAHPLLRNDGMPIFSPLTAEDRGYVLSEHKNHILTATKIGMFCLSLGSVCGGALVLALLPHISCGIGIAFIALGLVLLVLSLLAFLSSPTVRPHPIKIPMLRQMQDEFYRVADVVDARNLLTHGFEDSEDPRAALEKRVELLLRLDKDLRSKEDGLYALLANQKDTDLVSVSELTSFRDMQLQISEQLDLLYRCYGKYVTGDYSSENPSEEEKLISLSREKEMNQRLLQDVLLEKNKCYDVVESLKIALCNIEDRILGVTDEDISSAPIDEFHDILSVRNDRLSKLGEAFKELARLCIIEDQLRTRRSEIESEIQICVDPLLSMPILLRDFKSKYLESSTQARCLRDMLRSAEMKVKEKECEIEDLLSKVQRQQESTQAILSRQMASDPVDSCLNDLIEKSETIKDLNEQLEIFRGLLAESRKVNEDLNKLRADHARNVEELAGMTVQEQVLHSKISALEDQLDVRIKAEKELRQTLGELQSLVLEYSSQDQTSQEVLLLQKELRTLYDRLRESDEERQDYLEELCSYRLNVQDLKSKMHVMREDLRIKEEEVAAHREEILQLQNQLDRYEELEQKSAESGDTSAKLDSDFQLVQREIKRLEGINAQLSSRTQELIQENTQVVDILRRSEGEKNKLIEDIRSLRRSYADEIAKLQKEKSDMEELLEQRHLKHLESQVLLSSRSMQLEKLLAESKQALGESQEGALYMLAQQNILLSQHIKQKRKLDIQSMSFREKLSFTSPRFFGDLGGELSCAWSRPGISLEHELPESSSIEEKKAVVMTRCEREWLFALLGAFTNQELETVVREANALARSTPEGTVEAHVLFDTLSSKFTHLIDAQNLLEDWLTNCYSYITNLDIFRCRERWTGFLFTSLLSMHKGDGGRLAGLSLVENRYLDCISCFNGNLPLVLSSIGRSEEGTSPACANPLGDLNFESCGNISWSVLISTVSELLAFREKSGTQFILNADHIRNCILHTVPRYLEMLKKERTSEAKWIFPQDI